MSAVAESSRLDRDELQNLLLLRFKQAETDRRQNYEQIAAECYAAYVGHREPTRDRDEAGEEIQRSNVHIPRTYEYVDTLRSRYLKSLLGSRPYIDFIAKGATLELAELNTQKAEAASSFVDDQLERNNFTSVLYDFLTSSLVFPIGVMAVGWRYEERKVRSRIYNYGTFVEFEEDSVVWDDNEVRHIPWGNFWWDPQGSDLDSCRYVFQRTYETESDIKARIDLLKERGKGEAYELDWERLRQSMPPGAGLSDEPYDIRSSVGQSPPSRSDDGTEYGRGGVPVFEVLHYWTDDERGMLVNRELAWYGDTPYWRHGKKPFVVAKFEPLPTGELAGMSAVSIVLGLQAEANTLRNQVIDNRSMIINRMWWDARGDGDDSELVSGPHRIVHGRWGIDVGAVDMPDVTGSVFNDDTQNKRDMENALGVPAVQRGAATDTKQTATEVVTQASSAGIRFDAKIMLFESMGLKRLAYLMDLNNQQFVDDERVIRVVGGDDNEWRRIEPGQLIGEFDYRPAGSSVDPAANPEMRRQQLMQLRETLGQSPYIDLYELDRMILQTYGLRNIEKLMIARPEPVPGATPGQTPTVPGLEAAIPGMPGQPQQQMPPVPAQGGGING